MLTTHVKRGRLRIPSGADADYAWVIKREWQQAPSRVIVHAAWMDDNYCIWYTDTRGANLIGLDADAFRRIYRRLR